MSLFDPPPGECRLFLPAVFRLSLTPVRTLFLHMGPGMNAGAERLLLGKLPAYSAVDFWDQPASTGPGAFNRIAEAATVRAEALAQTHGEPIALIAHSFGGHFAREIILRSPQSVHSVCLISAGHDVAGQFLRLLTKLSVNEETPADLAREMRDYLRNSTGDAVSHVWEIIGWITRDPNFMRLYWSDRRQFDVFTHLTRDLPPLDFETFQCVVKDFLTSPSFMPTSMEWKGKAELVLGANDPLMDLRDCPAYWRGFFPQLEVEVRRSSGHYPHLESALAK